MEEFAACWEGIDDPRAGDAELHDVHELVVIALCSALCGGQGAVSMAKFVEAKEGFLRAFLKLEKGQPSHGTFSRLFRQLDPDQFSDVFQRFMERFSKKDSVKGKFRKAAWDNAFLSRLLSLF